MKYTKGKRSAHYIVMFFTLFIGYEWLMSGISKLENTSFVSGFHHEVVQDMSSSFGFYVPVLKDLVLPHSELFAYFIQYSELFIGVVFILAFFVMLARPYMWLSILGIVASVLSVFLSLNIFLYSGDPFFANPANPFEPSVSFDLMLVVMQICLIVYFARLNQSAAVQESENSSYVQSR